MNKKEFFDLLRFYLKDMPSIVIDDIISDYEEHFTIAIESGKTEKQICEELGSPEVIAKEYFENEKDKPVLKKINTRNENSNKKNNFKDKKSKKDKKNILIIILAIIGTIASLPFIFGFGTTILGIIFAIVATTIGLIATILSLIIAVFASTSGIFVAGICLFISIFTKTMPYFISIPDFVVNMSAPTKFFASISMIGFSILIFFFSIFIIHLILKLIKKLFFAIKWKMSRKKEKKNEKNSSNNSDNNGN